MIGIGNLFDSGSIPVLERVVQFTEARHRELLNNVANLSTPNFKPTDLDPAAFQRALGDAVDRRRKSDNPGQGPLLMSDTSQLAFRPDGLDAHADASHENILFHDNNDRDLERIMAHNAENTLAHRTAIELLRHEYSTLQTAISGRV
ncbi:MAG: hypothetical protein K8S99_17115 [Planctomycetes bacterium]|nr:hypothetical protein [Planctomycetota bacterium]